MMTARLGLRVAGPVVERLDDLATTTGRSRSQIVRFFLSRACLEALPRCWLDGVEIERIVMGQMEPPRE